jgi:hypothetical protein
MMLAIIPLGRGGNRVSIVVLIRMDVANQLGNSKLVLANTIR